MSHEIKTKAKKDRSYGFLTTDSFIVEVKASNPKTAYNRAVKENERLRTKMEQEGLKPKSDGKITTSYVTYGREGFAPVGIYKNVKLEKGK